ncbi:MAG: CinA family protein [Clostridia bacterium]|nr:CinA family protein [Clostridia bacterium]
MDRNALAERLVQAFAVQKRTLCFAESCTGGLAAATVVAIPGASEIFYGGIVSYDSSVKRGLLGVEQGVLETVGAVSEACALQMASGARKAIGADIAVSVTGIAGPGGGSAEKPVGLVYLGIASERGSHAVKLLLGDAGDRTAIRERAVYEMLAAALEELNMITK